MLNKDLIVVLTEAIDACSTAATRAMACKYETNPLWRVVQEALDVCADDLRELRGEVIIETAGERLLPIEE